MHQRTGRRDPSVAILAAADEEHRDESKRECVYDSSIYRQVFSTEAMREVWSDERRIKRYLDVERALAAAQALIGMIPQNATDRSADIVALKKWTLLS